MEEQYTIINTVGDKFYYKDKAKTILHRLDGPAIEWAEGNKAWFVNGKRHRLDGPAIERTSGDKEWYVNGKLHRLDGPAIEWTYGDKEWYVNDVFIIAVDKEGTVVGRIV